MGAATDDRETALSEKKLERALERVAERFGDEARRTILLDNRGRHLLALDLILEGGAPASVLDVGGGLGVNLQVLRELDDGARLALVDRFEEYQEGNLMGTAGEGLRLMEAAGVEVENRDFWPEPALPYEDASFEVATILEVVEHFPGHPLDVLREMRRVLQPGGRLILSGPNAFSAVKIGKLLRRRHPYIDFDAWTGPAYYSHFREYGPDEYGALLERSGFRLLRTIRSAEPWRTRALRRYHHRRLSPFSPKLAALWGFTALQALVPGLRETVFCVAEKP